MTSETLRHQANLFLAKQNVKAQTTAEWEGYGLDPLKIRETTLFYCISGIYTLGITFQRQIFKIYKLDFPRKLFSIDDASTEKLMLYYFIC